MSHPGSPRRSGALRAVVWLVVLGIAGGGGWFLWQKRTARLAAEQQAANAPRPAVPVTVMTARSGQFDVRLEGLGTVSPINTVVIRSRVDGQIEQVFFKEGQMVAQGDLLLRIDPRPYRAALDQAQAKLAQDQATLRNSQLDLQRYSTLAKQEIASRQRLESAQTAVSTGTALTQADQAQIDNAQVQLGYTEIRAPLSGRVGFRQVDAGNIVRANDTQGLLSIVQMDPINVLYTLPEGDLAAVELALAKGPVAVTATVIGERVTPTVDGTISVVNNSVDQASGTVQIKAAFDNKDMRLWPGQAVTTLTRVSRLDKVVTIAVNVVQHGPDGLFVWKVDQSNTVSPEKITVSEQNRTEAVVTSGLSPGDRFVTAGMLRLRKGTKVDPRESAPGEQQARNSGMTAQ